MYYFDCATHNANDSCEIKESSFCSVSKRPFDIVCNKPSVDVYVTCDFKFADAVTITRSVFKIIFLIHFIISIFSFANYRLSALVSRPYLRPAMSHSLVLFETVWLQFCISTKNREEKSALSTNASYRFADYSKNRLHRKEKAVGRPQSFLSEEISRFR